MSDQKKKNLKPKWPKRLGTHEIRDIPLSKIVARKLDNDLASAEPQGTNEESEDDTAARLTTSAKDTSAPSPVSATPLPFEHDWTSGSLTWAPSHERFATDSAYANHNSYPASCSNPARREMYYNCVTTDLKALTKQMWSIAHLVDDP